MPNIIVGLLALAFGLWGLSVWWWSVTELLRGLVPLLLLGVGFIALAAGISNVQSNDINKKQDDADDKDKVDDKSTNDLDAELKDDIKKPVAKNISKAAFKSEAKAGTDSKTSNNSTNSTTKKK